MRLTFAGFFLLLILSACSGPEKNSGNMTVFRYNESAGITSLDPAFARNQANVWADNQLFNSLVQLDSNLNIVPSIAREWHVSADGCLYTFYLRKDVYFHDSRVFSSGMGRRVTAADFVFSLNRLTDPALSSPGAWVMEPVARLDGKLQVHALSDTVLTIALRKPFPPFTGMLAMQYCAVVPHEAISFFGADFRSNPVGTGPFKFKMWKEGVKMVLLRNEHYFEQENGRRLPYLDAVAVSFIVDKQSAFLEFIKGNLDFISGLDAGYKDVILTASGKLNPEYADRVNMVSQPYLNTEYLGFITDSLNSSMKGNPLNKKEIRQAINYGFDRRRMIRYLRNGIGEPGTRGFIPAGMPGHFRDAHYGYDYNPQKTRELLAQAGYPMGKGLPPVTLSTNASYLDLCQFIQSQLSESGIRIKIDVSPPATLRENIAQVRVPFFRGSWIADYPDAENYLSLFYSPNHSPAGPNFTQYSNSLFDRKYKLAAGETDIQKRSLIYRELDSLVMADAPVVILFYDQVLRFTRKNVRHLGSNPMNLLELKRVIKN